MKENIATKITVGEIKNLLLNGKKIKVKSKNNEFVDITNYVDKGILTTYEVVLANKLKIKVSKDHKFFTNCGWIKCKDLLTNKHTILCENLEYSKVISITNIGKHRIVDITVNHPDHCYFGNGMLNHNTSKSLICAHVVANTQKKGGQACYIDTESAAAPEFWAALGVNLRNMAYIQLTTIEDVFRKLESLIAIARKENPNRLVTFIVDSVAGASTEVEMESDYGKQGYGMGKSKTISEAMRKLTNLIAQQRVLVVFTNQLRMNIKAQAFQDPYLAPSSKALAFHASIRVRLSVKEKIKDDNKEIVGTTIKAVVTKNRMGPPYRSAIFDMYFDSGISDISSWLDVIKDRKLATMSGPSLLYTPIEGEVIKTSQGDFIKRLNEDATFKDSVYKHICNTVIMQYKAPNSAVLENVTKESQDENCEIGETV